LPHHSLYIPPAEAIESVNIATNNFDAEQGLAGGAAVTVNTKSGTNQFHGAIFEYLNNHATSAKNVFYTQPQTPKNILNQFGGAIGGPIKHDKIFFFADWERTMQRQFFGSALLSVPSAAVRSGDFSAARSSPTSAVTTIYDPSTGVTSGSNVGANRVPFTDNKIPLSSQSSIARQLVALLPSPNL